MSKLDYPKMIFTGTNDEQITRVQMHLGYLYDERIRLETELQKVMVSEVVTRELLKRMIAQRPKPDWMAVGNQIGEAIATRKKP